MKDSDYVKINSVDGCIECNSIEEKMGINI